MVGAMPMMSGLFTDSNWCPCLCIDSKWTNNAKMSNGELGVYKNLMGRRRRRLLKTAKAVDLSSSFMDAWYEWRLSAKMLSCVADGCSRKQQRFRSLSVVDELGGQYEDTFNDVKKQLLNYFTYKAVRTVLHQLYEMNPSQYTWFYNFVATNEPGDGKRFLRTLAKEKQDLAERVMITRLHLYGKWVKVCDHGAIYKEISDENLELMRERLMETIIWPADDTNTEKMG